MVDTTVARRLMPGDRIGDDASSGHVIELVRAVSVADGFPLLAGVDLAVAPGEVVLVSGPNGAGKTSLLRLIAGLLPLTGGHGRVFGEELSDRARTHAARVALVGQESGCYDDLTVERNLYLHARAAGLAARHTKAVLERLDLVEVARVPHGRLSTGQRRRCTLAVGLARDAELLLLDEPHAGLDAGGRDLVDRAIRDASSKDATVVLVSHELDRARALADREVRLASGYVVNEV